jgi:hypothetical protein
LRAFYRRFEAGLAHAGLVQQDVALLAARWFYEAIAFGEIEPLDLASHLKCSFA